MMEYRGDTALALLRQGANDHGAVFRDGQEEAIQHLVENRGRLLVVQKTGWGKSFVYFIAAKMLRDAGLGPTLLVSPLLALMRNQVEAARRMGVRAETLNSANDADWHEIERKVRANEVDVLLISPERFMNERFRNRVLDELSSRIGMLVIDEAHCISDWGHDFRPAYRLIDRVIRQLPANVRVIATTATANNRVLADLEEILGPNLRIFRGDLGRESLTLQALDFSSDAERLAWLAENLKELPGSGIIYTLTVRAANQAAGWLRSMGYNVASYTSESENREDLEERLKRNMVKALVATTALGMGYDKPDLGFVVHLGTPGSVVAYYQQVGRAGRAIRDARGILLSTAGDRNVNEWFIDSAFPAREEVEAILTALASAPQGLTIREIEVQANARHSRIESALKILALEHPAPIVLDEGRWRLTVNELSVGFWERTHRLTSLRRVELDEMSSYVGLPFGQHMRYLIEALDGDASAVAAPRLPPLDGAVGVEAIQAANQFLRRSDIIIEPRKQWPDRDIAPGNQVSIPATFMAQSGRALCYWGDAGWGGQVYAGKYQDGRFSDDLLEASRLLLTSWGPVPVPTWVTCIPSATRPELVPDFAMRLASALHLPFRPALVNTRPRRPQKEMENSAHQFRNVLDSLAVDPQFVMTGPVLLVDDIVDSKWTLTVAAWRLRAAGSGPVIPFALAAAAKG